MRHHLDTRGTQPIELFCSKRKHLWRGKGVAFAWWDNGATWDGEGARGCKWVGGSGRGLGWSPLFPAGTSAVLQAPGATGSNLSNGQGPAEGREETTYQTSPMDR